MKTGPFPCSPEIPVHGSKEPSTVANGQTGLQRGLPCQLFIPVAEQLVPVFVVDPAYGTHARNASGNLGDEQSYVIVGRTLAAVTFEITQDSGLQTRW